MNLLRSEIRKITSTKTWLFLGIGSIVMSALVTFLFWQLGKHSLPGVAGGSAVFSASEVKNAYGATGASKSFIFVLILGVVAMTSEFRFGTIVPTFLATPRRQVVVLTKIVAVGIVAGAMALATVVVNFAFAAILLATVHHEAVSLGAIVLIGLGTLLAFVLAAVIGVGFGALLRNQVGAVVLAVVWVLVVEGIISLILTNVLHWDNVPQYLPTAAVTALVSVTDTTQQTSNALQPWSAAVILIVYAGLFAGLAFITTLRRDVT